MYRILLTTTAASLLATTAMAGGIDRAPFTTGILFEEGNYAELSFGYARPSVDGTFTPGPVLNSGNVAGDYFSYGAGVKWDIDNNWAFALILDNPVGADVDYTDADAGYPFAGTTAEVDSTGITGILKYTTANNISVYGGLRAETLQGTVSDLPTGGPAGTYTLDTNTSTELGYIVGVAWERPDIAARVALTYQSERNHDLDGTESFSAVGPAGTNTFTTTLPQTVTLDFQSGVAADTLVFGSLKWTDWSEFDIIPVALGSALVEYEDDVYALNLGVGRRFNETWSGAITIGYETGTGQPTGNLGPTEGQKSIGVGVTYAQGPMEITTGVRYVDLGDATTTTIGAEFEDNSAIGVGVRVGYSF